MRGIQDRHEKWPSHQTCGDWCVFSSNSNFNQLTIEQLTSTHSSRDGAILGPGPPRFSKKKISKYIGSIWMQFIFAETENTVVK